MLDSANKTDYNVVRTKEMKGKDEELTERAFESSLKSLFRIT